jgi:2-oxoisovalerate dehydrogenase E1 component
MHNVASNLTQLCFDDLDARPVVMGSHNGITPAAELEALFFPQVSWVLDAVHERILPLKGYQPKSNQSLGALARRAEGGRLA